MCSNTYPEQFFFFFFATLYIKRKLIVLFVFFFRSNCMLKSGPRSVGCNLMLSISIFLSNSIAQAHALVRAQTYRTLISHTCTSFVPFTSDFSHHSSKFLSQKFYLVSLHPSPLSLSLSLSLSLFLHLSIYLCLSLLLYLYIYLSFSVSVSVSVSAPVSLSLFLLFSVFVTPVF